MRTIRITVNLTPDEHEALLKAATRETRSVTRQALHLVRQGLGLTAERKEAP